MREMQFDSIEGDRIIPHPRLVQVNYIRRSFWLRWLWVRNDGEMLWVYGPFLTLMGMKRKMDIEEAKLIARIQNKERLLGKKLPHLLRENTGELHYELVDKSETHS